MSCSTAILWYPCAIDNDASGLLVLIPNEPFTFKILLILPEPLTSRFVSTY